MKNFKINDEEHFFKDKIEEITIEEFLEIIDILDDKELGDEQKLYYLDMTTEQFELFDVSFIEDILTIVSSKEIQKFVEIDGVKYGFDRDEKKSIKMVIDINYYRNDYGGDDALLNLLSIIFRPITTDIDKNGNYEIEKYNTISAKARLDIIKKGIASELYPTLIFFFHG